MRSEAEVHANVAGLEAGEDARMPDPVRELFAEVEDAGWMSGLPENNDLAVRWDSLAVGGAVESRISFETESSK